MKNKNDQKVFFLTAITVCLFVALVIWALVVNLKDNNLQTPEQEETEQKQIGDPVELITVENNQILELNSVKYKLPENYTISTAVLSKPGDFYNCGSVEANLNCRVFYITDGVDTFYLSTSDFINFDTTKTSLTGSITINFIGQDLKLMSDELQVYSEGTGEATTDPSGKLIKQVYGCTESICFNSGIITLQEPVNTATVNKFKDFISKITVN